MLTKLKKWGVYLLTLALVLTSLGTGFVIGPGITSAKAETGDILYEGFDTRAIGNFPAGNGWWAGDYYGAHTIAVEQDAYFGSNKMLKIRNNGWHPDREHYPLPATVGIAKTDLDIAKSFIVEEKVYITEISSSPKDLMTIVLFIPNAAGGTSQYRVNTVRFNGENILAYNDNTWEQLQTFQINTPYDIKAVLHVDQDPETQDTYDVYINGAKKAEGLHLQGGKNMTDDIDKKIKRIDFVTLGFAEDGEEMYADDFRVYYLQLAEIRPTLSLSKIGVGETSAITVTGIMNDGDSIVNDFDSLSFESADPDIAQVSGDGVITGISTGDTVITVTAVYDGVTKTATVPITVDKSEDASLKSIELDGVELDDFNPSMTEYNVIMPEGATSPPNVTAEPNFAGATVAITQALSIPGKAIIDVTAQDGITKRTYIINFREWDWGRDFYISPNGNDNWSGTIDQPNAEGTDGPFKTIQGAKEVIRQRIASGMTSDINVFLRQGEYYIDSTIEFDENDSGKDGYKITYKNYPGEKPVLVGGQRIINWEPYSGHIYKANVGTGWVFDNLTEDDAMAIEARYPNTGYNIAARTVSEGSKSQIGFNDGDIPPISNLKDLTVYIWPGGGIAWFANELPVASIDYTNKIITLNGQATYDTAMGSRYFLKGALELLDQPGEFYLDKTNGVLYYWPKGLEAGKQIDDLNIVAPKVKRIIQVKGSSEVAPANNIQFEGLTLNTTNGPANEGAIYIQNGKNISVKDCKIYSTGGSAIQMRGWAQGNTVYGNNIHDIGFNGVEASSGTAFSSKYINKSNRIENNHIYSVGRLIGHGVGVLLYMSGDNIVAHNKIHDTPRFGIQFGGEWPETLIGRTIDGIAVTKDNVFDFEHTRDNKVEYNDVYNCMNDSQDGGPIYSMATGVGNVINNNYVHDSSIPFSFGFGIYADRNSDYVTISNNVVSGLQKTDGGTTRYGIFVNPATNTKVFNNIIADNNTPQGAIGVGVSGWGVIGDFNIQRNIIYNSGDYIYGFGGWDETRGKFADFNTFFNNNDEYKISGAPFASDLLSWKASGKYDQYSQAKDPIFIDPDNLDYRLRYDSPAYALGFKDIDFDSIGLLSDFKFADPADPLDKVFIQSEDNKPTFNLTIGQSKDLNITGKSRMGYFMDLSNADISYESDNNEVATVNADGKITAIGEGIAKITVAVSKDGVAKSALVYVMVEDSVDKIETIVPTTVLGIGGSQKILSYGISKYGQIMDIGQSVKYSSSDANIAEVADDGTVTAKAVGNATITLTANGKSTDVSFTVVDKKISQLKLEMPSNRNIIPPGDEVGLLVRALYDDGTEADLSDAELTYTSSDESVISIMEVLNEGHNQILRLRANAEEGTAIITVVINGLGMGNSIKVVVGEDQVTEPWRTTAFGPLTDGYAKETQDGYVIVTDGRNVWGTADQCYYLYRNVFAQEDSEISVSAKIDSLQAVTTDTSSGIMIRETNDADSRMVHYRILPDGTLRFVYRSEKGGNCAYKMPAATLKFPAELKLTKNGDKFTAYYKEGDEWKEAGSINIDIGNTVTAGIAVFSVIDGNFTRSEISDLSVEYVSGDSQAPITTANISGEQSSGWYTSDVTVTLAATDDVSGIARTEYSMDSGQTWETYSQPIVLTGDGQYVIMHRSVDKAGNVEEAKTVALAIDKTAPVFNLTVNGTPFEDGSVFEDYQPLSFAVEAEDNLSGIATSSVVVDGEPYQPDTKMDFVGKLGQHSISAVVGDKAGNMSEANYAFEITTSIDSMQGLLNRYKTSGDIKNPLFMQLSNDLKQAEFFMDKGEEQLGVDNEDGDKGLGIGRRIKDLIEKIRDKVEQKLAEANLKMAVKGMEDFKNHLNNKAMSRFVSENAKTALNADADAFIEAWTKE
ncbi:OmpL47-type beta-barrel domain-containing protein [Mahella australiensis]|uniref:Ig domain protein group 2 domain protein n=1 Tax=Mahella australiensis (strain DSM 15567 / CIP 107919 / 50-1 BON) TaxID=697281 RepID=F3ZYP9_MAHA5|nr:Ig-like domain-containing protein [Mahella australiensis]AEE97817.1 Ig domain protein group 2 domain protein [Mahella australiensis 50-1 BON]